MAPAKLNFEAIDGVGGRHPHFSVLPRSSSYIADGIYGARRSRSNNASPSCTTLAISPAATVISGLLHASRLSLVLALDVLSIAAASYRFLCHLALVLVIPIGIKRTSETGFLMDALFVSQLPQALGPDSLADLRAPVFFVPYYVQTVNTVQSDSIGEALLLGS